MSRDLPAVPNLEHLKKQAKRLLAQLRQQAPGSTLSAAQHALAREYGFASWPTLKTHVESAAADGSSAGGGGGTAGAAGGPPNDDDQPRRMFDRFTEQARRVIFFARYEAGRLGSGVIETEHLLLAFVRDGQGCVSLIFSEARLSPETIREDIARRLAVRVALPTSVEIPISVETLQVLQLAAQESDRLQHSHIGAEHILLGILRHGGSLGASVLVERGLRLPAVRDAVIRLSKTEPA